jgi:transcriptional regulator with XRE-family HTH domain
MKQVPPHFETFGERLTWWRKARGYKRQGVLAELIGLKQASLSNLETGDSTLPSAATLLNLAAALNLRPEYLLTGEGPAEGAHFQDLTGPEAQLVMIFRQLPSDALREALLIDANDMLQRSTHQIDPVMAASEYERLKVKPRARPVREKKRAA